MPSQKLANGEFGVASVSNGGVKFLSYPESCGSYIRNASQRVSENSISMVGAEVTRLQMLWKLPGLTVEKVDLLTSAPVFQARSQ